MTTEYEKASENYRRYVYARDEGHLDWIQRAIRNERYYDNDQWDPRTIAELNAKGLPWLTLNQIQPTVDAMIGEYLRNRATVQYVAAKDGTEEVAGALSKVFRHIAANNRLEHLERQVFQDGLITGRGYFDVRLDFSDHLFGEVKIDVENPLNVLPDPDAEKMDPRTWGDVVITKWLSEQEIVDLFAEDEKQAEDLARRLRSIKNASFDQYPNDVVHEAYRGRFKPVDRVDGAATEVLGADGRLHRSYRVLERQFKRRVNREHFLDIETGDMRPIPSSWDEQRIAKLLQNPRITTIWQPITQIHWCVTVDSIVLFESQGFYKDFTIVPYFPDFRRGKTMSPVDYLISPQDMYNKVMSQELHVVNKTANAGWLIKAGSLVGMTREDLEQRGADTGVVIEWQGDPGERPEKIDSNAVPTGLDRLSFKARQDILQISGIGPSMRGTDREDVSGKAIQEKRDAGGTSMGRVFEALAETRTILANNVLDLVQMYYTEPRTLRVTENLFLPPQDVEVNKPDPEYPEIIHNDLTLGEYDIRLVPIPLRDSHDQTQFDEIMRLRTEAGVAVPDYRLIETSHLENREEIAEEVRQLARGPLSDEAQRQVDEMETQLKQLELQLRKAELRDKIEDANLKAARAAKLRQEIEEGNMSVAEMEKMLLDARKTDAKLEREDESLQIRNRALDHQIAVDNAQMRADNGNTPEDDDA